MSINTKEDLEKAKEELKELNLSASAAKKAASELTKLRRAKFDSAKQKYTHNGRSYSTSEYNSYVKQIETVISDWKKVKETSTKRIKTLETQIKNAATESKYSQKQIETGKQYLNLRDKARGIKVKDLDSAIKSIEAWKSVKDFAEKNPDAVFKVSKGSVGSGDKAVNIVGFQKLSDRSDEIDRTIQSTAKQADTFASKGTTTSSRVWRRIDGKTQQVTEVTVTDPEELARRRARIEEVMGSPARPMEEVSGEAFTSSAVDEQMQKVLGPDYKNKIEKVKEIISSGRTPTNKEFETILGPEIASNIKTLRSVVSAAGKTLATTTTSAGGVGGAGGTGGTSGTGGTKKPTNPKVGEQWRGPKGVLWEWNGEKWARSSTDTDSRFEKAAAEFRKMAPQYAWILDIDQSKYPDVRKLVQRAIKGEMFKSPEGIQRFIGELEGTTFFNELREKGTKQKIVNLVGDLGFDDSNLGKLLANSSNLQWDDDTLTREVYKEAFRKNADGSYVHSQAQARATKSNDYLSIQNIGRAFFNQLTDDTVQRVLIGELNPVDVTRQQRELAKGKYGHLADLLEQGLSMEEITNSYRDQAARLLERDVNDVNMGDATYQAAYDFVDESGQKRLMTTGEWARKLRTDTQYGWDKTENAKQEARSIASSIIQAFGRVM